MTLPDIEVGLSDEEVAVRDTVRKFATEVMRPVGQRLDKLTDPADVIAARSELWSVFERYRGLGIGYDSIAEQALDPIRNARLRALINEELGWGDAGLAISLSVSEFHRFFARLSGQAELIDRYCRPDSKDIGCWAITEPSHGSDMLRSEMDDFRPPARKPDCIAEASGDHWILNGQKAAWVSNGTIATAAVLFCGIQDGGALKGGGVSVVPLDLPGVSKGKPLDKLGQRALNQGEIFFENARIPKAYMIVSPDAYAPVVEVILALANGSMGTMFVGLARAALELAIDYSKQRVQGRVPIFEHQTVRSRLFKMFAKVEAARSLARRVMLYNTTQPPLVQYAIASKVFSTNTAFEVASEALQIFGGNGLTREYPVEKLLRDARASMVEDGCNELLGLVAGGKL